MDILEVEKIDIIGPLCAFSPGIAAALWMILRLLWWRNRNKGVELLAQSLGFRFLDKTLPDNFPLEKFSLEKRAPPNDRHFREVWAGELDGRQVLFFMFNSLWASRAETLQTVIAVHGGKECFPAANSDPKLRLETVLCWTIAYWPKKVLKAPAIQAVLSAIPGPGK